MYNIKQPISLTLAKAEELTNTTSCPSTKGSTEAQLFLSGVTGEQTGRSTQAQTESWLNMERVREMGIHHGVEEILACRQRVKAKWDTIIIVSGCRDSSSLSFLYSIWLNLLMSSDCFANTGRKEGISPFCQDLQQPYSSPLKGERHYNDLE